MAATPHDSLRDLRILNAIAEGLNRAPTLEEALQETLARVTELLGLKTGWVWLLDPETGRPYLAAAQNLPPYLQEPVRMTGAPCWCLDSFSDGELTPSNVDILECSRLRKAVRQEPSEHTAGLSYHASIPLFAGAVPLGVLNVTGTEWRQLEPHELHLLSTIGYQVGIALERFRLAEDATRLARAEERAALARTIHDTLAQGLTAIVLHIESALKALPDRPEAAAERLHVALETAREDLEEARQSVLHLRSGELRGQPLSEAVSRLGRTFTSRAGVRVIVEHNDLQTLPRRVETELYFIAMEALNNIERHAAARQVHVRIHLRSGQLKLQITDDGNGFDIRAARPASHGLVGIRREPVCSAEGFQFEAAPAQARR